MAGHRRSGLRRIVRAGDLLEVAHRKLQIDCWARRLELAFALYLTYIEAYELMTWCILCLSSLLLIALISMLAIAVKVRSGRA